MFQRLQVCQELAKRLARDNNDESIEKSTENYNKKVKPVEFKEGEWVLLKVQNFLNKNKKLAETYKGPFCISKVHSNGTAPIKQSSKHDTLVNTSLLVKYKTPA